MNAKATLLTDKKKLQSRIKNLIDLVSKGNSKAELQGANSVLEKIYIGMKNAPSTSLENISMDMFKDQKSAFVKAGGYLIGKNDDTFFLFKGSTYTALTQETKKRLGEAVSELETVVKEGKSKAEAEENIKQTLNDLPIAEAKPFSKSDLANMLYDTAKNDQEVTEAILRYTGEEKLTKKLVTALSYGDMLYMADGDEYYAKRLKGKEVAEAIKAYEFKESRTEMRLTRKADKNAIGSEELKGIAEEVGRCEKRAEAVFGSLAEWKEKPSSAEKNEAILNATTELIKIRTTLKELDVALEKSAVVSEEDEIAISEELREAEESELSFVSKEIITPTDNCPMLYQRLGLKRENEIINFFENDEKGKKLADDLGIETEKKIKIINYGAFSADEPEKALENLLLYAKSLNEMVEKSNDRSFEEAQANDGNFAI